MMAESLSICYNYIRESKVFFFIQIQEIIINVDEQEEHGEKKSAKEALMMWCQRNTRGYREVHIRVNSITNFISTGFL